MPCADTHLQLEVACLLLYHSTCSVKKQLQQVKRGACAKLTDGRPYNVLLHLLSISIRGSNACRLPFSTPIICYIHIYTHICHNMITGLHDISKQLLQQMLAHSRQHLDHDTLNRQQQQY